MFKLIISNLLLPALFALVVFPSAALAQKAQPKDVIEFFLALPAKYYEPDTAHRQKLIAEGSGRIIAKDVKNGYLAISGDGGDPGIVLTIFKKADGNYIVGLNVYDELNESFYFLEQDAGAWRDISARVVPQFSKRLKYELPRYGTTVKVSNRAGLKLYDLEWKQGKFVKK